MVNPATAGLHITVVAEEERDRSVITLGVEHGCGAVYIRGRPKCFICCPPSPPTLSFSVTKKGEAGISRWMLWFRFHNVFRDSQQFRLWLLGTLSSYCLSLGSPTGSTGAWGLFIDLLTMIHGQCRDVFSVPGL